MEQYMEDLRNKIVPWPDGSRLYFLGCKPTSDPNVGICLLSDVEKEKVYSLWYVRRSEKENGDGYLSFEPYKGDDYEDLKFEILEDFCYGAYFVNDSQ
jgi:hypothetical protein